MEKLLAFWFTPAFQPFYIIYYYMVRMTAMLGGLGLQGIAALTSEAGRKNNGLFNDSF